MAPSENTSTAAFMAVPGGALFSRMAISPDEPKDETPVFAPSQKIEELSESQLLSDTITSPGSFFDVYQLGARLQSGSFGIVYEASRVDNRDDNQEDDSGDQKFAVKVIDRTKLSEKDDRGVFREVGIMKELVDVENVITLVDFYVTPEKLYVVQHLAAGGDVFDRLIQRKTYTEQFARELAKILLRTLQVVHSRKIIHRDLKPGNLLLASRDDDFSIMLCDFGFAKHLSEDGYCTTRCGTPAYVAPEVVLGVKYNTQADLWSAGCILYMLLSGYLPFAGKNHKQIFQQIRAGNFCFHERSWANVSIPAKQLVVHLLTVNPERRWTAQQALQSTWMTATAPALRLHEHDLTEALSRIRARRRLKAAMDAVRWATTARFWNPEKATLHQHIKDLDKSLHSTASNTSESSSGSTTSNPLKATTSGPSSPTSPKRKLFKENYTLLQKVRMGAFATVWRCQHNFTGENFAVKVIPRAGLSTIHDEMVLNEVSILQSVSVDAPDSIVTLNDFFEEEDVFYIVMELLTGGSVINRVSMRSRYSERDARDLIRQLLTAVEQLHKIGVAHRDIKPQNLLLRSKNSDSNMKLCDFGFARRVHTPESLTHRVGTPPYVAPEILKNIPHDERVDLWSVGVTAFVLLVGYPPFAVNESREILCQQIKAGAWKFHDADWAGISPEAKDLIKGLLQVDPAERLTASDALQSKWIQDMPDETLSNRELSKGLASMKTKRQYLQASAKKTLTWFPTFQKDKFVSKPISTPTQAHESVVEIDN